MAILSVVILAIVAFSVDIAWIALTKNQLQNVADAAALAAADPLTDGYVEYSLATNDATKKSILQTYLTSARDKAHEFAKYNAAGGATDLVTQDEDIEYGYTDNGGVYTGWATFAALFTKGAYTGKIPEKFPNTVKVFMRRDGNANGSLDLFFAPVLGMETIDLTATASGTIYGGKIDSFLQSRPQNAAMLPMTYDVNAWYSFLATGKDPDGNSSTASNGLPHLQVYPGVKDTGNFGQLSLDDAHAGTSEIVNWIHNGLSTFDIAALFGNNLLPLSKHDPNLWDWRGNPGFKAKTVMDVNTYSGKIFVLPLFQPKSTGTGNGNSNGNSNGNGKGKGNGNSGSTYEAGVGNGSWYDYNIVEFVGIRITSKYKDNQVITVQPAAYVDPFVTFANLEPPNESSTITTTFTTPKLSR